MDPKDDNATNPVPRDQTPAQGSQTPPDVSTDSNPLGTSTGDVASAPTPSAGPGNDMPSLASEEPATGPLGSDTTSTSNPGGFVEPTNPPPAPDPDMPPLDTSPPAGDVTTPSAEPETPLSPMPNQPFEPSGPGPADNPAAIPPQPSQSDIPPTAPLPAPASTGDKKTFLLLLVVAIVLIGVAAFLLLS